MIRKIIFLTATRADFGKLKSLIKITKENKKFKVFIVVTGMHMLPSYGKTHIEVSKYFKKNIIIFNNQKIGDSLEIILAKTIKKLSKIINRVKPDLLVTHGDRIETLSCAISSSLNHILTAHIEGGELSGTIDDTIRHAVTKLAHLHFVSNENAKKRVLKMGEKKNSVFNIGSADIDSIKSDNLPTISLVKRRYNIKFRNYVILLWHPVTSEKNRLHADTTKLVKFLEKSDYKTIVIYPNNDPGTKKILDIYSQLNKKKFKIFPSLRFEYFISLLKNAKFIIGNSSCAIHEAPYLKVPAINIGTRQNKRFFSKAILNLNINDLDKKKIINFLINYKPLKFHYFGKGDSDKKFIEILNKKAFWRISTQKIFRNN